MRAKIKYANGKTYDEEIVDIVIYNKAGENILYAYSTVMDEHGVCVIRPGRDIDKGFVVYPEPKCTCCQDSDCECCHICPVHGTIKKEG